MNQKLAIRITERSSSKFKFITFHSNLIIANINRNILLNDMQRYVDCMNPNGGLLLSGFYEEDIPFIDASCTDKGLTFVKKLQRNNWVSLKYVN